MEDDTDRVVLLKTDQLELEDDSAASNGKAAPSSNDDNAPRSASPDDNTKTTSREPALIVYVASCVAALGGVLFGYDTGIISGAKSQMQAELGFSCSQISLIVAMLPIGGFVASLFGGELLLLLLLLLLIFR